MIEFWDIASSEAKDATSVSCLLFMSSRIFSNCPVSAAYIVAAV